MPASTRCTSTSPPVEEDSSEISSSDHGSAPEDIENDGDSSSQSEDDQTGAEGEEDEQEISVRNTHGKKRKLSEAQEGPTGEGETATTVLSHADRRRQKRKERQIEEHDDNMLPPCKKARQGKKKSGDISDTNTKRQNSVWVGNLAFKTTVEDLRSFFAGAGEITRVNMPTKVAPTPARKPENRGFAYVDFSAPEGKSSAIALSEQPLTGRKLLIKDGDDYTGRPKPAESDETGVATLSKTAQKILKFQKQPPGPTLFLGNLGFETTEANITEMLDAHHHPSSGKKHRASDSGAEPKDIPGKSVQSNKWIRKVRMGTFEDSGLCKGFAFVDFVSTENATSALVNPKNYLLNGRKLVIEYASPDAVRRGMPKPKQQQQQRQVNKDDDNDERSRERRGKFATAPRAIQHDNDEKSRERRGKFAAAPQAIQHDNVEQDAEEHRRPPKRQRVEKAERTSANKRDTRTTRQNPKYRAKPGAALASAQRQSVAIIPSQGKKIKFD